MKHKTLKTVITSLLAVILLFFSFMIPAMANDMPVFSNWSREECEKATEMNLMGEPFSLECWCKTTPALLMVDAVYLTEKLLGKEMEPAGGNYETKAEAAQYYDTGPTIYQGRTPPSCSTA